MHIHARRRDIAWQPNNLQLRNDLSAWET